MLHVGATKDNKSREIKLRDERETMCLKLDERGKYIKKV